MILYCICTYALVNVIFLKQPSEKVFCHSRFFLFLLAITKIYRLKEQTVQTSTETNNTLSFMGSNGGEVMRF